VVEPATVRVNFLSCVSHLFVLRMNSMPADVMAMIDIAAAVGFGLSIYICICS
jgi:hypothetical protein